MQVYFLKPKHILIFSNVPRDLLGSTETSCIMSPLKHIKPKAPKASPFLRNSGSWKMVALRFIVNIEPSKQNFIQFREPGAFAASTDTLTLSPRTQWQTVLPVCSGWRWQTDEFPHLYALGLFWAILDEFRGHWKVNPDRTECLNYKTKSKQTWPPLFMMAPTIVKWNKKKKKEEITESLLGKSILLCHIALYPSVKWGD